MNPPHLPASLAAGGIALSLFVPSAIRSAEVPAGVLVRDGYQLSVAVDGIKTPRFLAVGPDNTLFVSVPKAGMIIACRDTDGDGTHETQTPFIEGKDPTSILQGMQWHDDWLWYAQLNAISKARDTNGDGKADEDVPVLSADQLPTGKRGGHMWRALLIHKGRIYTHVGDQTNATDEPIEASERKKIWSFALDGSDKKLFASGLRNTEKLAVRPGTDEIWGVDHDTDQMAAKLEGDRKFGQPITDHNPPAELNHYREGKFYGHPYGELKMVNFLKDGTEILGRPADCTQAPDGSLLFSDDFGNNVYRLKVIGTKYGGLE